MLLDALPFSKILNDSGKDLEKKAIGAFLSFIEKKLGGSFVIDRSRLPLGRDDLVRLSTIANKLKAAGVITSYQQNFGYADEPLRYNWVVRSATTDRHMAGGMSASSDEDALVAALAEALERFIWFSDTSFVDSALRMSVKEIARLEKPYVSPARFSGFSEEQRFSLPRLKIDDESEFRWIRAWSILAKEEIWAPAQIFLSGRGGYFKDEPIIRTPITTGLATWPTREGAILRGILEIVERDAFMIAWANQLSMPRIDLEALAVKRPSLRDLVERSRRYGLEPRAVRLVTDAPTYAVCASVEDKYGQAPGLTIGLKAHYDLPRAVEGALLEALRMRQSIRRKLETDGAWDETKDPNLINHLERAHYWSDPFRAKKLEFLFGDANKDPAELGNPDCSHDDAQLEKIKSWAQLRNYEILTLSFGSSRFNVSPWQVEMVTMPELQPMHQNERYRCLSGERLREVPKMFGYDPLPESYVDEPHPFA